MQRVDPLFGLMKFRRRYGFFGMGFWETEFDFTPVEKRVKVYITAGRNGISEAQRDFYRGLEQRYTEMTILIGRVLIDLPFDFHDKDFLVSRYGEPKWVDFELATIIIPSFKAPVFEWEISYNYLTTREIYAVHFEGWKPGYGKVERD